MAEYWVLGAGCWVLAGTDGLMGFDGTTYNHNKAHIPYPIHFSTVKTQAARRMQLLAGEQANK